MDIKESANGAGGLSSWELGCDSGNDGGGGVDRGVCVCVCVGDGFSSWVLCAFRRV